MLLEIHEMSLHQYMNHFNQTANSYPEKAMRFITDDKKMLSSENLLTI